MRTTARRSCKRHRTSRPPSSDKTGPAAVSTISTPPHGRVNGPPRWHGCASTRARPVSCRCWPLTERCSRRRTGWPLDGPPQRRDWWRCIARWGETSPRLGRVGACSPGDLGDRLPRPRRLLLAERLLDQLHEHGTLRSRQIGAEDFSILHRQDAGAVHLDGQLDLRLGTPAQEGDDAFRLRTHLERAVGIGLQEFPELLDRPHDRGKHSAEVLRKLLETDPRSEEHTPELQSLTNLVCRLLLHNK